MIRYCWRTLRRSPGFSAVALLTLALGIGANTAIFSVYNAVLLRELPVRRPERLVELSGIYRNGRGVPFSFPMFRLVERGQRVFSGLMGWSGSALRNVEANGTMFLDGVRTVTGNYYSVLGTTPLLGRLIAPGDVGRPVAMIAHEFWQRRFGLDPAVVGKTIRIEGRLFTIVGVTRKWFTGMTPGESPAITIPIGNAPGFDLESRAQLWVFATGRLKDGIAIGQARAQLQSFWPEVLRETVPTTSPGQRRRSFLAMRLAAASAATGINAALRAQFVRPLYLLMGVAALVLLIACVNLANLMLARAAARDYEMSTRLALGAGPWRIVRQLLTESLLLSGAGAVLGLAFAAWGSRFLVSLMREGVVLDVRPDWRVFSFSAIAAALTGVLIGLAPAWKLSRRQPATVLRRNERGLGAAARWGKALMVAQIALSLVLLQTAGLFLRSLENLRSLDPGFRKTSVLEVSLFPRPEGYKNLDMNAYRRQLVENVGRLPGVSAAGFSYLLVPAGGSGWRDTVSAVGEESGVVAALTAVSPGFFKTLGIPLVAGRDFDWTDDGRHPPVAILDANLARRIAGGRVRFGVQPEFQDLQIVGVVRSARLIDIRDANAPVLYVPCLQHPYWYGNLLVRGGSAKAVQDEILSLGHEFPAAARTLDEMSERALVEDRATALLSSVFAASALLLAGIGLFGLMSYSVNRRTREIGIRMALGSQRGGVLRMVLRETLLLTLAGIAIGLPCAFAGARLIAHVLFRLPPYDAVTLAAVSGVLLAAGAIGGYLPAWRAMHLEPASALRHE